MKTDTVEMGWLVNTCNVNQGEWYFVSPNVWQGGEGDFICCEMSVCTYSRTSRLRGLVLLLGGRWGRVNDNHRVINLWALGNTTTILWWHIRPWECSGDTRFFCRKSLINLIKTLLRFFIRHTRDRIYDFLEFMTVRVAHGIIKKIAHFRRHKLTLR